MKIFDKVALSLSGLVFLGIAIPALMSDNREEHIPPTVSTYQDCVQEGGIVSESNENECVLNGTSYVDTPDVVWEDEAPPETTAEEVGKKAGETYNEVKDAGKEFWDGFSGETGVDETLEKIGKTGNDLIQNSLEN